ncbi:DUF2975 domain-containing protein [Neobacillus vireti]|uniref:YoaS n=1 Tax=Neobacillus vireti LMG 21834 TaxID=1131730 RepID=A0AB94IMF7_9BACI|nr:DUF2975 domain-containing protein [Neobacillus vireti]ETI68266.1 YoaS [Neobacillus vireti LMG 21834]KLT17720.1 membrane protein [Neobacillus vireti]
MKRGTVIWLKGTIFVIGIITFVISIFFLPGLAKEAAEMNPEYAYLRFPVLIGLYATEIPFFLALYQALKLLHYIEREVAFSELAVFSLGYIKKCAFIIIGLYVIGILMLAIQNALHPGIAIIGVVIIFAALVISLFSAVLQELLRSAIELKSENDLTV